MGEDSVNVVTAGERTQVDYQTSDYGSATEILVTVIDPKGNATEEKLHATAPGKYTADLPTSQTGLYHFNIRRTEGGEIQNYMTTAAAVQFSDEYKFDVSTDSYMQFVGQYGRMITEQDSVWTRIATKAQESYPLTNFFLALAICLFLADVAMRRFQYVPKRIPIIVRKSKQAGEGTVQEAQINSMTQTAQMTRVPETDGGQTTKAAKAEKKQKRQKKPKQPEQTLDTSQLLKKKDDRNM